MLLNAENLDEMCQSDGDIRANLTSCYKAAAKIYNSSSDDKDFKKTTKDIFTSLRKWHERGLLQRCTHLSKWLQRH